MKKIILLVAVILSASFLPFIHTSAYTKYLLLGYGILLGFFADIVEKDKFRWWWICLKAGTVICFVAGIAFIIDEDTTNANNFKTLLLKSDSIFKAQSISFKANNDELKGIFNNISSFQQRQFNPLPDSCYFMFDLIINYSKLEVKSKIKNKKLSRIEGKDSLFSFEFSSRNDVISTYIEAMNKSIVITFENESSKIKFYTQYHQSPQVEKRFVNQHDEMIFRYNLVPVINYEGDLDYLDLKMIKSSSHNFISSLDFEMCKVKMCFGTLAYGQYSGPLGNLKGRIENAKVLLDTNGVDFIEVKSIKQINTEPLNFIGKTDKLIINTLKDDCLSPLYIGDQNRRGGK